MEEQKKRINIAKFFKIFKITNGSKSRCSEQFNVSVQFSAKIFCDLCIFTAKIT